MTTRGSLQEQKSAGAQSRSIMGLNAQPLYLWPRALTLSPCALHSGAQHSVHVSLAVGLNAQPPSTSLWDSTLPRAGSCRNTGRQERQQPGMGH